MKYLKTFENYSGEEPRQIARTPQEYASEWNPDYKFIVYLNGKPVSGWEYLSDALKDGIGDEILDLLSEDIYDFEDEMDMALGEHAISVEDEDYEIDEDDLNEAIAELVGGYSDFEGTVQVRLVNNDEYDNDDESFYDRHPDKIQ